MAIPEKLQEALVWLLYIVVFGLVVAWFAGVFNSQDSLVKPCEGMSGDMLKVCADYYISEEGWTWDEVINGVLVKNP